MRIASASFPFARQGRLQVFTGLVSHQATDARAI
jgi:hypothetical protein